LETDDLGLYLRRSLLKNGLSQSEAAKRGGFSRQSLSNWMNGDVRKMELESIVRLSTVLDIAPYSLLQKLCRQLNLCIESIDPSNVPEDHVSFVKDINIPDNSVVLAGSTFVKEWEVQNTGNVRWENRRYVCLDLEAFDSPETNDAILRPVSQFIDVPVTAPDEKVSIRVKYVAPDHPGTVRSSWRMIDRKGNSCFPEHTGIWCQIRVADL